jgi:hypothetical protein
MLVILSAIACDKPQADAHLGAASAAPSGSVVAASATAPPSANAVPSSRMALAWRGSYKSTAAPLYIPPDWKGVHWNVKETNAGIGEGTIALTVDAASGRVQGALEGPLGPATVDGLASEGKLTATIARRDPTDKGFTGTLVAALGSNGGDGSMNVSLAEASAVRTATFTLSPESAPTAPR